MGRWEGVSSGEGVETARGMKFLIETALGRPVVPEV